MTEMTERLRAVRSKDFCSFFPWDKNTLSWKSQSHGIIKVPQKGQKELRGGE